MILIIFWDLVFFFSGHDLMQKQIIPTMTMFWAENPPDSLATPQFEVQSFFNQSNYGVTLGGGAALVVEVDPPFLQSSTRTSHKKNKKNLSGRYSAAPQTMFP